MPRHGAEPHRPQHGRQAAGLRSAFLPANGFQGPKQGYVFKRGDQGAGYYRVHELISRSDFLAALEQAEARDNAAMATATGSSIDDQQRWQQQQPFHAAYRQPELYRGYEPQPEWARVNVSEVTRAFQQADDEERHMERVGPSRNQRASFKPLTSQINFQHGPAPSPRNYQRRTMPTGTGSEPGKDSGPSVATMRPAGGRPNMSGPSNQKTGVGVSLLANGVSFLTT